MRSSRRAGSLHWCRGGRCSNARSAGRWRGSCVRAASVGRSAAAEAAAWKFRDLAPDPPRSEEHTSELQSLMRIPYAVFCVKKKNQNQLYLDEGIIPARPAIELLENQQ